MTQKRSRWRCPVISTAFVLCVLLAAPAGAALDPETAAALDAAINGEHRSAENKARDKYRKPRETLEFLGFRYDMTVVEIWPGSGWYTEILAPALKESGRLYAAVPSLNASYSFQRRGLGALLTMTAETRDVYRDMIFTHLDLPYELQVAPPGSVDMVLTFRNVHNWVMELFGGGVYAHLGFKAMYDALKPAGILGVVDHNWPDPATEDPLSANGYISEQRTIEMAEAAGFKLVARSDLLRNPKDTRDYPRGVWSLPPVLAMGDEDREKYLAIGESDRFLLKFVKPAESSK